MASRLSSTLLLSTQMATDLFSKQAAQYAQFRPLYPSALFSFLASSSAAHELAWDCATGNGQAALGLVPYFEKILATDQSAEQIAHALVNPKVEYRVAAAIDSGLQNASVDLVTVAQALHWFAGESFYAEVSRVLKPRGLFAAWAYGFHRCDDHVVQKAYDAFARGAALAPYWAPQTRLIQEEYKTLEFPFNEIECPEIETRSEWTLVELEGYLRSWSATQSFIDKEGMQAFRAQMQPIESLWGEATRKRVFRSRLCLRAGFKPGPG